MSSVLGVELLGLTELSARLDSIDPSLQSRLRVFFAVFTIRLRDQVKANIAAIFRSTGPMYQSVTSQIEEAPGEVVGSVSVNVPYARIQEEGGKTAAHVILPKTASVLAFMAPGEAGGGPGGLVFAKRVNHPGSNIPARPYASLALAQLRGEFDGGIRGVVGEATQAFGIAAE